MAKLQDGTYDFVGTMLAVFRAPGVTRENVLAFQTIAEAVQSGGVTKEEAERQIANLSTPLRNLWDTLNSNGTAIQTIIAAIGLYLMIYYQYLSDAEDSKLQAMTERHIQVEQQIVAELQKQGDDFRVSTMKRPSIPQLQRLSPRQKQTKGKLDIHTEPQETSEGAKRHPPK